MKWFENSIKVEPPTRPKKLTATRLASILGLNPWSTPFEAWCEITKTYQKPFEDTKYTLAGKAIEPLQIAYMRKAYFMTNIKTPTDIYGKDYFSKTYGDFFPSEKVFGGMWDSLLYDDGKPCSVLEFKTTKRVEDWQNDIPEYYALQASLYAFLLGLDDVIMVASFLTDADYDIPEKFIPSSKNTTVIPFKISERYPSFKKEYIDVAVKWWNDHVKTGISPTFDEKKDLEILAVLRKNNLNPTTEVNALIDEAETIKKELTAVYDSIAEQEKRLKTLTEQIKEIAINSFRESDTKVSLKGSAFEWCVSKQIGSIIDKEALSNDGLLENYTKATTTYKITTKEIKE